MKRIFKLLIMGCLGVALVTTPIRVMAEEVEECAEESIILEEETDDVPLPVAPPEEDVAAVSLGDFQHGGSWKVITNGGVLDSFVSPTGYVLKAYYATGTYDAGDTTYSCAALIKRYYLGAYGVSVYNLNGSTSTPLVESGGGSFVSTRQPVPGDIVRSNISTHWMIVTAVNGNEATVIQQSARWNDNGVMKGAVGFKTYLSDGNVSYFHWTGNSGSSSPSTPTTTTIYSSVAASSVADTTAHIEATLNKTNYYSLSECGYYIGTSANSMAKGAVVDKNPGITNSIYYNLSGLTPGMTYYYQIYAICNGTIYWTEKKTFTTTGSAFAGNVDTLDAYPGLLCVAGWSFEKVHPTELCYIDIYIGDDCVRTTTTGVLRTDVKQAYSQTTNNQGFYDVFPTQKWGTGQKSVRVFAVNKEKTAWQLLLTKNVTLKANTAPVISDVKVTNATSTGYTVTCKVTDSLAEDIKSIQFRTSVNNGTYSSYKNGSFNGATGIATFNVKISDFSNQKGTYQTEICATDQSGATTTVKTSTVTVDDPLAVKSQSLILGGTIGLNFDMYIPQNLRSDTGAYVMINGKKNLISSATKNGDYHRFTYKVSAKEMYDDCTVTVYNKSGTKVDISNAGTVNGSYVYSVGKYLDSIISTSTDANMVALAKAMKNYGYAAQYYFGYNTSKAGTLPQYSASDFSSYKSSSTGTLPAGLSYAGSSLMLNDNTTIRHYFMVDSEHSIADYKFKVAGTSVTAAKSDNGLYYIAVTGIPANKLSSSYKVTINDTYTMDYSAMSYAYKAVNRNRTDALAKLMYAMEDYNKKAKTYFGN